MEGFLNPTEVLKQLKLRKNMVVCDFGSGSGGWAIPLAKKLTEGRIFAIDILEEPLSVLKGRAEKERIYNIETIRVDVEKGTKLMDGTCDLVLMTNLLFECQDIKKVAEEGKRILKEGGKVLIVDWQTEAQMGPEKRVSSEEIKEIAEKLGFKLEKEFEAGLYHYGLLFVK